MHESGESSPSSTNLNFSEKEKRQDRIEMEKRSMKHETKSRVLKSCNHLKLKRIVCQDSSFITITIITKSHLQNVSKIKINGTRWLFLGYFWPLLN